MRVPRSPRRISALAPLLSLVLIAVLPLIFRNNPGSAPTFGPEAQAVADAVDHAPYRIGSWVGRETPMPEAAIRMLRPNATLSRRFSNLDTNTVLDVVIVHCGDARDMLGHYPPVCYPNAGWVPDAPNSNAQGRGRRARGEAGVTTLEANGVVINATMYQYARIHSMASESRIRIFNFFVLPDGAVTHDIDEVTEQTSWMGASVHGVAQIQILTSAETPYEEARVSANEVLDGFADVFSALGVKKE